LKEILEKALSLPDAEYLDARWEKISHSKVIFSGRELKEISQSTMSGGHVRALADGAMGCNSCTDTNNLDHAIGIAVLSAKSSGRRKKNRVILSPAPVIKETVTVTPESDPRTISLEEKKDLLREYVDIAMGVPKIQTISLGYSEHASQKIFINTDGTCINQEQLFCAIGGSITARDNGIIQSTSIHLGASDNFAKLRNRHKDVEKKLKIALDLLSSKPVESGVYTVILDPSISGVFTHEAFGHLSEADTLVNNHSIRNEMKLGRRMGKEILNISDRGNLPGAAGHYIYDDEGVASRKTPLVKEGILVGRLHSRETAAVFGEEITGNARALDYNFTPIVRMSNIFIEPGEASQEEMISSIKKGIYLIGHKGGQTIGDMFTFGAQYGYLIENGKISTMLRDLNITGNLFITLQNIMAIGKDFTMDESGGCGKGSVGPMQMLWASGHGGTAIMVKDVVIGGI
jgi:TldD protein